MNVVPRVGALRVSGGDKSKIKTDTLYSKC